MSEILPCPFCGSKADMQNQFGSDYWVQCTNLDCGATDGTNNSEPNSAALRWNRRAAPLPPAVDEQIKQAVFAERKSCCDAMRKWSKEFDESDAETARWLRIAASKLEDQS